MGVRILDFWLERLHKEGVEAVIINGFHLAEQLSTQVRKRLRPVPVEVRVEPVLLDTGGGIRNALDFFGDEPFAVINGDIACDAPLAELYQTHMASGSPVSLLMHDCPGFNNVAVSEEGTILGFGQEASTLARTRTDVQLLAFTGIHFTHPAIIRRIPYGHPAGILPLYRQLIRESTPPRALFHIGLFWREMGSVERYRNLNEELSRLEPESIPGLSTGCALCIHPEAVVAPDVRMEGFVAIGAGCRIEAGSVLMDSILWDHVHVDPDSTLRGCILADGVRIGGRHDNEIFIEVQK
jgi:mannose-1-phosphate guanylyltransferase